VYSFGVGEDVSFDLAVIEKFGAQVHAFDPTPKSVEWVKKQTLPSKFRFHELGVAGHDGVARFSLPRPDYVSYSVSDEPPDGERVVEAQVERLATIMKRLGHSRIDLLKMDIEGSEYSVIDDLAKSRPEISQLLVEFHHEIGNPQSVMQTRNAISRLNALGYQLFHTSETGREYSFIRAALSK
jgi:FkbM family methyltransferase